MRNCRRCYPGTCRAHRVWFVDRLRFVFRASQVTAREKLAIGSNSFPLNPLLAPVLGGAEGIGGRGGYFGKSYLNRKMKIL